MTNPSGSDETTCKLMIQPVASIDTRPFVQPEHFAPLEIKASLPTKQDIKQMEPPKVITPLQSLQTNEGSPVLLQATIIGKPTPNVITFLFINKIICLFFFLLVLLDEKWCSISSFKSSSYTL